MSRELGVDRSICQRVLSAISATGPGVGLGMVDKMPGVEGLKRFVKAFQDRGVDGRIVEAATAAVEQTRALIRETSGSHAKLRARVHATLALGFRDVETNDELDARRRMYSDAMLLSGSGSEALTVVTLTRPVPDDPGKIEFAAGKATIGFRQRPGGMTLVETFTHDGDRQQTQGGEFCFEALTDTRARDWGGGAGGVGAVPVGSSLIGELCSNPLPIATSRSGGAEGLLVEAFDPSETGRAIDVVVARRASPVSHPAHHETKLLTNAARVKTPTKHLVIDSYVHKSIAAVTKPTPGAYFWQPTLLNDPRTLWYERIPGVIRLELLGAGDRDIATHAWKHHSRMTRILSERLGWSLDEYVGYRIEVRYPVWGAVYLIYFMFDAQE